MNEKLKNFIEAPVFQGTDFEKLWDIFDGAVYINLKHRADRKERVLKQFESINIKPQRFEGCYFNEQELKEFGLQLKNKINVTNFNLSMLKVASEAKRLKLKNILIFEDDCIFDKEEFLETIPHLQELKNIKWDLFYLGGGINPYDNSVSKVSKNLYSVRKGLYQTHAYAINSSYYDVLLADVQRRAQGFALDNWFACNYARKITITLKRPVAFQEIGFSDIQNSYRPNDKMTRDIETHKKFISDEGEPLEYNRRDEKEKKINPVTGLYENESN